MATAIVPSSPRIHTDFPASLAHLPGWELTHDDAVLVTGLCLDEARCLMQVLSGTVLGVIDIRWRASRVEPASEQSLALDIGQGLN